MLSQLKQELVEKKEALGRIQEVVQKQQELGPLSIAIVEANIMMETTLVSSPSMDFSQDHIGEFKKHTKGIGFDLLR
jgi:hypothetical protein